MSGIIRKLAVVLLLSATSVIAQVARPAEPHTVSQVMDFWVTNTEQLLVPAAEIMPEAKYSFVPANGERNRLVPRARPSVLSDGIENART